MKIFKIYFFFFFALVFNIQSGQSQDGKESKSRNSVYVGFPAYIFDVPDFGIYVGYSFEIPKRDRFSWEFQASFHQVSYDRDSDNFAHDGGKIAVSNLVFGPRIYLMKPDKKVRIYLNFLPGLSMELDEEYVIDEFGEEELKSNTELLNLGYALGAYLQIKNKFLIGAAYEPAGALVFKLGYKM